MMMPDREKVIRGLENTRKLLSNFVFPFSDDADAIIADTISMLKEQDPVPAELEGGGSSWWWVCGECHGQISKGDRYCRHCGHEINWK